MPGIRWSARSSASGWPRSLSCCDQLQRRGARVRPQHPVVLAVAAAQVALRPRAARRDRRRPPAARAARTRRCDPPRPPFEASGPRWGPRQGVEAQRPHLGPRAKGQRPRTGEHSDHVRQRSLKGWGSCRGRGRRLLRPRRRPVARPHRRHRVPRALARGAAGGPARVRALGGYLWEPKVPGMIDLVGPVPALDRDGPHVERLRQIAGDTVVCVGYTEAALGGGVYSSAVCVSGDGVLGHHRKVHIPPAERGVFLSGERLRGLRHAGRPAGDADLLRQGLPRGRARAVAGRRRDHRLDGRLARVPGRATHARLGRDVQTRHFNLLDQARAVENQVVWVSANQVGTLRAAALPGPGQGGRAPTATCSRPPRSRHGPGRGRRGPRRRRERRAHSHFPPGRPPPARLRRL